MQKSGKIRAWAGRLRQLDSGAILRKGLAAVVAGASMMAGVPAAFAGGGAGNSDGGGGGVMDTQVTWAYQDADDGAFGPATDLNSVYNAFGRMGVTMLPGGVVHAQEALNEASANCWNRFNDAHPDQIGQGKCRVVSVGVMTGPSKQFSGEAHHLKNDWLKAWASGPARGIYSNNGVSYNTTSVFQDQPGTSINSLVDQYTSDSTSIVVVALNQYEPVPADVPPAAPSKSVQPGTSADSMSNHTKVFTGTGRGVKALVIRDRFFPEGKRYTIERQRVTDVTDGRDVSGQFAFGTPNGSTPAGDVATATWTGGRLPDDHELVYELDVVVHGPETGRVRDTGSVYWKGSSVEVDQETPSGEFPTWKPNPDKSWVLWNGAAGKWDAVVDPSRSDATGGDGHVFMDGDRVAGVVNATVDPNLVEVPGVFVLTDDWSAADYLVDQDGRDAIRVYEADAAAGADGHYRQSSVDDIAAVGRDVTDMFDIEVFAGRATATAKPAYRDRLKGMGGGLQVTMLVPFTVNFANGKGAEQVRKDHGRRPGDELTFCAGTPGGPAFVNKGSERVNGQTVDTNEPGICGYVPPVRKDVVAEASQGGDQASVDGKVVHPGQRVEYQLTTQPKLPDLLAYQGERVVLTDVYDRWLEVDKQTLEIMDLGDGRVVAKSRYRTVWDDDAHMVQVVFTDQALIGQWRAGGNPRIQVRFEGTVSKDAPTDTKVGNRWMLTINNSLTPSNEVFNTPPKMDPSKQVVSSKDQTISIDGKTLMLGDTGVYRVTIDALQADTAYRVWRLGVVDDFEEEYLGIDPAGIEVQGSDGRDHTKAFNIQVRDGVVYAFARTVDTEIPATGMTAKGDPQPSDLKAYAESDRYDPLRDPAIDQALLGHSYVLVIPFKVIKADKGHVVKNQAVQVTNSVRKATNQVHTPLAPLNPAKDVVVKVNGESSNGKSIYKDDLFLYRLESSILPADRAYPQTDRFHPVDQLDPSVDRFTGQWAVYAGRDLYRNGHPLARRGEKIAGSGMDTSLFGGDLFTMDQDRTGKVTISATPAYLALVSESGDREVGWVAYIQCQRIATTDRHENRFTEYYQDKETVSNVVWTRTPDMAPRLRVVKFDTASGIEEGDRNDPSQALTVDGDTDITVRVFNDSGIDPETGTGPVFLGRDLRLDDRTVAGDGQVVDWRYPDGWAEHRLKPGEYVDIHGTLRGVTDHHTDRVKATGTPLTPCPVPVDNDPFGQNGPDTAQAPKDAVVIDGVAMCGDTTVESNTDDWNGRVEALADTGSNVAWLLLRALMRTVGSGAALGGGRWLQARRLRTASVAGGQGTAQPDDRHTPGSR